jgi:hypothetical protein
MSRKRISQCRWVVAIGGDLSHDYTKTDAKSRFYGKEDANRYFRDQPLVSLLAVDEISPDRIHAFIDDNQYISTVEV